MLNLTKNTLAKNRLLIISSLFLVGILSRLLPHLPNATAMLFAIMTFGFFLPRIPALLLTLAAVICSDLLLAYFYNYPFIGYWSLFTYSGFLGTCFIGSWLEKINLKNSTLFIFSSTFMFWLWTNFGVWLSSGMYAKNMISIVTCYIAALPFLKNQFLGDLICIFALTLIQLNVSIFLRSSVQTLNLRHK